jgi:hypothetical protein
MSGTHHEEAVAKSAKAGGVKVWIRRTLIAAAVLSLVAVVTLLTWSTLTSLHSTAWIKDDTPEFKGIADYLKLTPTEDAVANIVIVHGISDHCLGYSDALIQNLAAYLTEGAKGNKTSAMQAAFETFDDLNKKGELGTIYPPLNANCNHGSIREYSDKIGVETAEVMAPYAPGDSKFVVDAQEALCDAINRADRDSARCFRLGVVNEDKSDYVTGFVRVVSLDGLRFFELVWTPATRWVKDRLVRLDASNKLVSEGAFNQTLKSYIINSAIADAVAYLSDPGVLVNLNLLQTFCLVVASNSKMPDGEGNLFTCNADHLTSARDFDGRHRLFFVTHSLGTRVLFDTLGLLASDELIGEIRSRLRRIKAQVPGQFRDAPDNKFPTLLESVKPNFLASIDAIYAFTNQVPLLSANLTSPFVEPRNLSDDEQYEAVGKEFQVFLEKRNLAADDDRKLQIVSLHDPDDLLSYQLGCWYYQSQIRYMEKHTTLLKQRYAQLERELSLDENNRDFRPLLRAIENVHCSALKEDGWTEAGARYPDQKPSEMLEIAKNIKEDLEKNAQAVFVDAPLRMNALRVPGVLAHPLQVHSNYYQDKKVHQWISYGYH